MSKPQFNEYRESRLGPWIVLAMVAMVAIPASVTLLTVRTPGRLVVPVADPTPHGYTWSLLLFIIPIAVIAFWFLPHARVHIPRRAFWRTLAFLVPLGCALDFFFARYLFVFRNAGATLGVHAPTLGGWVPIEEYLFYLTGFLAVLLIYIWLDEYWLAAYNVPDYAGKSKNIRRLVQFHGRSTIIGGLLITGAIIYKKVFSYDPDGFPVYFVVLVSGGLIPSVGFYPTARRFINWRAMGMTMFLILLISLLWEATLAVPYGWWGYQPGQMLGVFIDGWSGLPIEAVCVWMAVTYGTIITFETVKLWQASEKPARHAFLGKSK